MWWSFCILYTYQIIIHLKHSQCSMSMISQQDGEPDCFNFTENGYYQASKNLTGLGVRRGSDTPPSCLLPHEPQEITQLTALISLAFSENQHKDTCTSSFMRFLGSPNEIINVKAIRTPKRYEFLIVAESLYNIWAWLFLFALAALRVTNPCHSAYQRRPHQAHQGRWRWPCSDVTDPPLLASVHQLQSRSVQYF